MNSNSKFLFLLLVSLYLSPSSAGDFKDPLVKQLAFSNGYAQPDTTHAKVEEDLVKIGEKFFESENLSLNGRISCSTCHIDRLGTSDGLPNSAGIGGTGEGSERLMSGGQIVPRNALALFGVGGLGFDTFFWDGRVESGSGEIKSPFGNSLPDIDPLIVAVHLPVAEIRETLQEDQFVASNKKESVEAADRVYAAVVQKLRNEEPELMAQLANAREVDVAELQFIDIATSLANFIRFKFRLQASSFSEFMAGRTSLTEGQLDGALIFFGKGKCSTCHRGPYFSDFKFHTIAMSQTGFGKNGFGVDYGRYNSTFDTNDLYKFRTPSLHNVSKTGPYGHSGSQSELASVIISHYDPLATFDSQTASREERTEFTKKMMRHDLPVGAEALRRDELADVIEFLKALEFDHTK